MVNYTKLLAEVLGTFVFLYVILQSGKFPVVQPFVIAAGLLVAIFMFGSVSGGHFNPAVSTMLHLSGDESVKELTTLALYVVAQVVGGGLAFYAAKGMKN